MTRYKIAVKDNAFALQQEVSSLLEQGWTLQGGVAMCPNGEHSTGAPHFAQALTKQSEAEAP